MRLKCNSWPKGFNSSLIDVATIVVALAKFSKAYFLVLKSASLGFWYFNVLLNELLFSLALMICCFQNYAQILIM